MRSSFLRGARWLAALLAAAALQGVPTGWPGLNPVTVRRYGERDGLPHQTVYDIARGSDGRLWVGTVDGAAVFNGRTWRPWALPLEAGSNWVRAVLPARDGSIWFGTQDAGLWQWREGLWIHHDASRGLPFTRINALLETRDASGATTIWAGSGSQGLGRWDGRHWTILDHRDGLPGDGIWRLREGPDPEGGRSVWICTMSGLARFKGGRILRTPDLGRFDGWETGDILTAADPEGFRAWAASWDHGLAVWDGHQWKLEGPADGFPSTRPVCLGRTTPPGQAPILWVGTYNDGLLWRQGQGGWQAWPPHQTGSDKGIYALLATGGHPDLWVGFLGKGLAALDSQGWEAAPDPPDMPSLMVYSFAETPDGGGSLWMGATAGIARWSGGRWEVYTQHQGLAGNWVDCLCPTTSFGRPGLLAGGVGGLSLWQGNHWRKVEVPGLSIGEAQALLEVRPEGKPPEVWVGTSTEGLLHRSGGRWERIGMAQGLPAEDVFTLHETREPGGGSVWAGFRGGGLARFHQGRWTCYGVKDGLPTASVYALADTPGPAGPRLWVATPGGGLGWMDVDRPGAVWHRLNRLSNPPLPADTLMGLATDLQGRLYLTSTQGVIRLTLPSGSEDRPSDWRLETFTTGDGLPSNNCISGAVFRDADGRMWVGTVHGSAVFDPRREAPPDPLPCLVLEGVQVDGKAVNPDAGLHLSYRQRHLHLSFSLPVFHRAEDVRYRTQILGFEDHPTTWMPEGRWDLAALPSGHFELWIQARDAIGRLSAPLRLPVTIEAPPWRRPWAFGIYAFLLGGLLLLTYRLRTRWLREQNRKLDLRVREGVAELEQQSSALRRYNRRLLELNEEKTRMLALVAHDLRNPLSGIHLRAQQILEEGRDTEEGWAQSILSAAARMESLIDRILDVAALDGGRVQMDSVPMDALSIVRRTVDDFRPKAAAKGFDIELEAELPLPAMRGDPFYFKEVMDNLVSNAVKFTPAGDPERKVVVRLSPGQVEVVDRGPGFQSEDLSKVFGAFVRLSARP
ncbi:MAG TPA: two-component regulator propeller domain-containing protein, partial [Holophagaceae bacterium]